MSFIFVMFTVNAQLKKWMNPSYCSNHTSRVVCKGKFLISDHSIFIFKYTFY